jgi:hypothetical protein
VPDGTTVEARVGDTLCGSATTYTYSGTSQYRVFVPPAWDTAGCGSPGAAIDLYVGGSLAGSLPWRQNVQFLDLVSPGAG